MVDSLLGIINGISLSIAKSIVLPGKAARGLSLLIKAVIFSCPTLKLFNNVLSHGEVITAISIRPLLSFAISSSLLPSTIENSTFLKLARNVSIHSAAMFGADANWGRVLCAIGYSGASVDINKIDVSFKSKKGEIQVCKDGAGVDFDEDIAKQILLENEIEIIVDLNDGDAFSTAWGCDLTYDYVKINGDYRT